MGDQQAPIGEVFYIEGASSYQEDSGALKETKIEGYVPPTCTKLFLFLLCHDADDGDSLEGCDACHQVSDGLRGCLGAGDADGRFVGVEDHHVRGDVRDGDLNSVAAVGDVGWIEMEEECVIYTLEIYLGSRHLKLKTYLPLVDIRMKNPLGHMFSGAVFRVGCLIWIDYLHGEEWSCLA